MRENIKKYFKTGCKPTEAQFAELINSIVFKDEAGDTIPASRVEGLERIISLIVAQYASDDFSGEIVLGSQVEASWLNEGHTLMGLTVDGEYFELNLAQGGGSGSGGVTVEQIEGGVKFTDFSGNEAVVYDGEKGNDGAEGPTGPQGESGSNAHVKQVVVSASDSADGYDHVYFKSWEGSATYTDAEVIADGVDLMANVNGLLQSLKNVLDNTTANN